MFPLSLQKQENSLKPISEGGRGQSVAKEVIKEVPKIEYQITEKIVEVLRPTLGE